MNEEKDKRIRIIGLRLTTKEFDRIEKNWLKSSCRKLSDYIRRVIFRKPVVSSYRNKSVDELMAELALLRRELNAIGVNLNQAVHRLHTLDHLPQMVIWLQSFERDKATLLSKIEEIRSRVNEISETWLQ